MRKRWPEEYLEDEIPLCTWEVYGEDDGLIIRFGFDKEGERLGVGFRISSDMAMDMSQVLFDVAKKVAEEEKIVFKLPTPAFGSENVGIPNRLKEVRQKKEWSQDFLSEMTWTDGKGEGISKAIISKIEEHNYVPSWQAQLKLASTLNIPHGEIWPSRVMVREHPASKKIYPYDHKKIWDPEEIPEEDSRYDIEQE